MGRKVYQILVFLFLVVACRKDKPQLPANTLPTDKHGAYIVCEGIFNGGNASLYFYNAVHDSVFGDMYAAANNKPLGDVFQSMERIGDYFFLAINNSNKVVVANVADLRAVASIAIPYPRYILALPGDRAYVSSLYRKNIYLINTKSFSVVDSIVLPFYNTEKICLADGYVYACCWDTACGQIYKIDINTNKIVQSIAIAGRAPHDIVVDKEQMLWVLSGNQPKGKTAYWTRIDPSTGATIAALAFPVEAEPIKPVLNAAKDTLYYIEANYNGGLSNNGIYRMGIHQGTLPTTSFIAAVAYQYFWALGIDPVTGNIYVGDPEGFNQKGSVAVYQADGTKIKTFSVGTGPGHFYFEK